MWLSSPCSPMVIPGSHAIGRQTRRITSAPIGSLTGLLVILTVDATSHCSVAFGQVANSFVIGRRPAGYHRSIARTNWQGGRCNLCCCTHACKISRLFTLGLSQTNCQPGRFGKMGGAGTIPVANQDMSSFRDLRRQ